MNNERDPKSSEKTGSGESVRKSDPADLPPPVVDRLKEIDRYEGKVPETVRASIHRDAAEVLKQARSRPVKPPRGLSRRSWTGISAGVLASALLVFVMLKVPPDVEDQTSVATREVTSSAAPMAVAANTPVDSRDIDGNGRLDIRDAFALARALEQPADAVQVARMDQNQDGILDKADIKSLADAAVLL